MSLRTVLDDVERLPRRDKWRLVRYLLDDLEGAKESGLNEREWKQALRDTYGILSDDPIERPPQSPLDDWEAVE